MKRAAALPLPGNAMEVRYGQRTRSRLERNVVRERIVDGVSGEEFTSEQTVETVETHDGTIQTIQNANAKLLMCGHLHRPGQLAARCDACSKKAGHTVLVCKACAVTCPMTGQTLCLRCTKPGPDGRRYSPQGYKMAQAYGALQPEAGTAGGGAASPVCAPTRRNSLVSKLLEWW